jgi:hypothetical protein
MGKTARAVLARQTAMEAEQRTRKWQRPLAKVATALKCLEVLPAVAGVEEITRPFNLNGLPWQPPRSRAID